MACFTEGARPLAGGGAEEAAGGGQQEPAGRPPPAGGGDQEAQEEGPRPGKCSIFVHSIWFIRNTSNIRLVLFLFIPANLTSPGCLSDP